MSHAVPGYEPAGLFRLAGTERLLKNTVQNQKLDVRFGANLPMLPASRPDGAPTLCARPIGINSA
jgi:hypothetical protein